MITDRVTSICCIIPAFNEARRISSIIEGVKKRITHVVVIDDGSVDQTYQLAQKAGARVIRHNINRGKGMALRTGFEYALRNGFDAIITLDADGQHLPEEIEGFISAYKNNDGDIIIGSRLWNKKAIPLYRYIPNKIGIYCISRAAGCRIEDTQSGFRLYSRKVLENISIETTGFETESEILIKAGRAGYRIHSIPVTAIYQGDYKTNFRPIKDFYRISILFLKLVLSGKNR